MADIGFLSVNIFQYRLETLVNMWDNIEIIESKWHRGNVRNTYGRWYKSLTWNKMKKSIKYIVMKKRWRRRNNGLKSFKEERGDEYLTKLCVLITESLSQRKDTAFHFPLSLQCQHHLILLNYAHRRKTS